MEGEPVEGIQRPSSGSYMTRPIRRFASTRRNRCERPGCLNLPEEIQAAVGFVRLGNYGFSPSRLLRREDNTNVLPTTIFSS